MFAAFNKMRLVNRVLTVMYVIALIAVAGVARDAHAQSGNVYGNNQAQVSGNVEQGIVLQVNIKQVEPNWQTRAAGAAIGGTVGNVLVSNPNVDGQTRWVANLLVTAVGGLAGERIANRVGATEAQELVIAVKDGNTGRTRLMTVVQPAPYEDLAKGDKVFVSNTYGAVRVLKDDGSVDLSAMR